MMKKPMRVLMILAVALTALIAMSVAAFAEEEYTVHYETWGQLKDDCNIDDRTVSWTEGDLGVTQQWDGAHWIDVADLFKSSDRRQYLFRTWYIDETLETEYTGQTYAELAGSESVKEITLYAGTDFWYVPMQNYGAVTYKPWPLKDSLPADAGNYYLLNDVKIRNDNREAGAAWVAPRGETQIDLHAHSIKREEVSDSQGAIKGSVIWVPGDSSLTLEASGGYYGSYHDNEMIKGGDAGEGAGGGILVEGTLHMPNGTICDNKAKYGGGVAVAGDGQAYIRRVYIRNNTAENGGGVAILGNGYLSFTGLVKNNAVGEGGLGGGIYVDPNNGRLALGCQPSNERTWYGDNQNWWSTIDITANKAGNIDSDTWISKEQLESGNRIIMDTVKNTNNSPSTAGFTISPLPAAQSDEKTIITTGLNGRDQSYFYLNNNSAGDYEITSADTDAGKEAAIQCKHYKVTYKVDDQIWKTVFVSKGTTAQKPEEDPERAGSTFDCWLDMDTYEEYDFNTPVTKDKTLVALFEGDHYHDGHIFQAWNSNRNPPDDEGYYYLTQDIRENSVWQPPVNKNVHVCLNGHSIQGGGSNYAIYMSVSGEYSGSWRNLEIYDCSEGKTGFIKGDANVQHTVYVLRNCSFTLHSGTIRGNDPARGTAVRVSYGTFNMKGGTVTGNNTEFDDYGTGSGVSVYGGTFNMSGGTITGNSTTHNGAGVSAEYGTTFNMSGGNITGNTAGEKGGGVYVDADDYFEEYSHFNLIPSGKDINITGNTAGDVINNVHLKKDSQTQSVIGLQGDGGLTADSLIGVTSGEKPTADKSIVLTDGYGGRAALSNFFTDEEGYKIVEENDEAVLKLAGKHAVTVTQPSEKGSLATDKEEAYEGSTVTITLTPEEYCRLKPDSLKATGESGAEYEISGTGKSRTFTMPEENVTISGEFEWIPIDTMRGIAKREIDEGETTEAGVAIYPETANPNVIWTSRDESIATATTFDQRRVRIKGIKAGEVTIHGVSVIDDTKYHNIKITVVHHHAFTHVEAKSSTCTEPGIDQEYWICDQGEYACGKAYSDSGAQTEVDPASLVTPALGHDYSVEVPGTKKAATYTEAGKEADMKCSRCDSVKTGKEIPKLTPSSNTDQKDSDPSQKGNDPNQKGRDGTAVGPGASAASAERAIVSMTTDTDPKGAVFSKLKLKSSKQTKTSISLKWTKVTNAKMYVVYGNKCGKNNKPRRLVTVTGSTKVIKKINKAKLKKGTYYKFIIVALDKNNNVVSTSKLIHVATKGGKVGNHKSVTVKAKVDKKTKKIKKVSINKGKSLKLKTKLNPKSKKHKVKKHVGARYESTNGKIATVNGKGKITAKAKGTCNIYVYAQNGVFKKIKVTVK